MRSSAFPVADSRKPLCTVRLRRWLRPKGVVYRLVPSRGCGSVGWVVCVEIYCHLQSPVCKKIRFEKVNYAGVATNNFAIDELVEVEAPAKAKAKAE